MHAVGGIRSHYRPVRSGLHPSSCPIELARAFRERLGLVELYLADLDAIASKRPPDLRLYRRLHDLDLRLWIDAGLNDVQDLAVLEGLPQLTIVLGLETAAGPDAVRRVLDRTGPDRLVFSVDLFEGVPRMPPGADWPAADPGGLLHRVLELGVRRVLLLDLARVGTGRGTGTEHWLPFLRASYPQAEVSAGGGIAAMADLNALQAAGAAAVLVGSALHDGRIGRKELEELSTERRASLFPPASAGTSAGFP